MFQENFVRGAVGTLMVLAVASAESSANAGAIVADFTTGPNQTATGTNGANSTSFEVELEDQFFVDEGLANGNLLVVGNRANDPTFFNNSDIQLRKRSNGLGICSSFRFGECAVDQGQVDGLLTDEWLTFSITNQETDFEFAVRTVTFGDVDGHFDDDEARFIFANGNVEFDFDIRDLAGSNCSVCTINFFDVAINLVSGVDDEDDAYAFLASSEFTFRAVDNNDNWRIRSTEWVINGPGVQVPEPATLALIGAGLLGIGGMARRRKAA